MNKKNDINEEQKKENNKKNNDTEVIICEDIKKNIDKENSELRLIAKIKKDYWKKEQEKALKELGKKVVIPGFRKGKAPVDKVKKQVGEGKIWEEAIDKLLNPALREAIKHLDEKKDIILDSPTFSVDKVSNDELEIVFIYPIFPQDLKIKDFKKLDVKFHENTDKEIKDDVKLNLNKMLSANSLYIEKPKDNDVVENGDKINFDFEGFIDNVPFEGGEAKGFDLVIGSNQFIPGFEEALIGKKNGWEGEINVKFPNDYYKEDLKGKDAVFKIKINKIEYKKPQELNEDFIKNLNIPNVTNEKQLNDYLYDLSKREMYEKERTKLLNTVNNLIASENEIPLPRIIVYKELDKLLKQLEDNLKKQNLTLNQYYKLTNYTPEKVKEELLEEAKKLIKKTIINSYLIQELDIKPTDEDYERQYQRVAKLYNMDKEVVKQFIQKEQIENVILNDLLIDKLISIYNPSFKIIKEKIETSSNKEEKKENNNTNKKEQE